MSTNCETVRALEHALRANNASCLPRDAIDLRPVSHEDELQVKEALRQLLVRTTVLKRFDNPTEFQFKDIDQLHQEARETACSPYVLEVLNYLRLYRVLAEKIQPLIDDTYEVWFGQSVLSQSADRLLAAVESVDDFDCTALSSRLVLGKLQALDNRKGAAQTFAGARVALEANVHVFLGEIGINTYFDQAALRHNEALITERQMSLPKRDQRDPLCNDSAIRFLMVLSCDERFMQIYLPYWLAAADYLRHYGFAYHVILTAESADDAARLMRDAEELQDSLAVFRGSEQEPNVSFSAVSNPGWCPSPRTFASCARFLYAREISEQVEIPILVQDIDFELTEDPGPWYGALPSNRIALTSSCIVLSIDPWQKFRGGAFLLPPTLPALNLVKTLEEYLLLGLGEQESWFLDQNALGFLYEAAVAEGLQEDCEGILFSLDEMRPLLRPFGEQAMHPIWEKRHVSRWGR